MLQGARREWAAKCCRVRDAVGPVRNTATSPLLLSLITLCVAHLPEQRRHTARFTYLLLKTKHRGTWKFQTWQLFGNPPVIDTVAVASGISKAVVQHGEGDTPKTGDEVWAHYEGKLEDGSTFDSSRRRSKPFVFFVGVGQVIAGWDEGFASMRRGEKAVLSIEASQGYGTAGAGGVIPPNARLHFDVELIDFGKPGEVSKRRTGAEEGGWCAVM